MIYVFTVCPLNFVPGAKLLAESVRKHLPGARAVLGLADARPTGFDLKDEGFDVVLYLEDFKAELGNPLGWTFGHTAMELMTALTPFVARKLMERRDCEAVLFFAPHCLIYGELPAIRDGLKTHSVLLTPHASQMHEVEPWIFFERNILKVGGFDPGFIGLRNNEIGKAVASWWRFRLKYDCVIDPDKGLLTDQKWIDLLPCYIDDIKVIREPAYNVAHWNTFQRTVSKESGQYLVDGMPAQFVHFSGFDNKIGAYARGLYDSSSEPHITNIEPLQELSLNYSERLAAARTQGTYADSWAFGRYGDGREIPRADRRRYRKFKELRERFPDPFSTVRLESYSLYCRKQEKVELEAAAPRQAGLYDHVPRSVLAHNEILRQLNDAFSVRLTEAIRSTQSQVEATAAILGKLRRWISDRVANMDESELAAAKAELIATGHFDCAQYLEANPDVAQAGVEPFLHFIHSGIHKGRLLGPERCSDDSLVGYACVLSAYGKRQETATAHPLVGQLTDWLRSKLQGMNASALEQLKAEATREGAFDVDWYLAANPDVATAGVDPFRHWISSGLGERRTPLPGRWAETALTKYVRILFEYERQQHAQIAPGQAPFEASMQAVAGG